MMPASFVLQTVAMQSRAVQASVPVHSAVKWRRRCSRGRVGNTGQVLDASGSRRRTECFRSRAVPIGPATHAGELGFALARTALRVHDNDDDWSTRMGARALPPYSDRLHLSHKVPLEGLQVTIDQILIGENSCH